MVHLYVANIFVLVLNLLLLTVTLYFVADGIIVIVFIATKSTCTDVKQDS